ncbi:pyruvate kinase [Xanthovirga aplysinae]|uniref:pyruvate kinase n=1 Tax=Xanthovirga aplysinae TaxID=2529853 RepID=UPI0012BBD741|nr:pyruvate kinase [Xanthovirga aplysinae]MTI29745.1 pyruvate kinase [Xanthovirga aplysinae]
MLNNTSFCKTKIVTTIGPASDSKEMMGKLMEAGANVFRLNFSHGTHDDHLKRIETIRELNKEQGTYISILQDLQGPKIRTTEIENGQVDIVEGQELRITIDEVVGNQKVIGTTHKTLPLEVKAGERILIDDGNLELKVKGVEGHEVVTEVIYGGPLKSRKGINLPETDVIVPALTEKDKLDLEFGLKNHVDWVALSFVRSAQDILDLKKIINESGEATKVMAKIEKPEAIKCMDEIIEACDGIMVARGDLGVEMDMEEVPLIQKELIAKCNRAAKPVIVATQMLESMVTNPRPTRAEANDVANAVLDGADAVMLSAESASGKFPEEAVNSMTKVIRAVEKSEAIYFKNLTLDSSSETHVNDGLVLAACNLARNTGGKAILGLSRSGYTGLRLSSHRPKANIFVFTDDIYLLNRLNLSWGIRGYYYDKQVGIDETLDEIRDLLIADGHLEKGDLFITTGSMPRHWSGRTNMMKVSQVD